MGRSGARLLSKVRNKSGLARPDLIKRNGLKHLNRMGVYLRLWIRKGRPGFRLGCSEAQRAEYTPDGNPGGPTAANAPWEKPQAAPFIVQKYR